MVRIKAQRDIYFVLSAVEFVEVQQHVGQTRVRVAIRIIQCDGSIRRCQGLWEYGVGIARPTFLELSYQNEGEARVG